MFTNKKIWNISYPILLSLVIQNLINITDTAFLGRVGEIELGASALAGVFYMAIYMIGFGFSLGAQILMARRNGEKRYHEIGSIMMQGTIFLLILAVFLIGISYWGIPIILKQIISSQQIYTACIEYLDYRVIGLLFTFIGVMYRAFFVGITQTKVLTVNAIIMASSNIILDYLLIFGKWGFPEMGIGGSALASTIAEGLSALFLIIYTIRKVDIKKYRFFTIKSDRPKLLLHILNISVWTMIQYFITMATWFLFFVAIEHLGERPLAVSNIVRSVSTLLFMPTNAFAGSASTLVSNAIGAGLIHEVTPIIRKVIRMCYAVILPLLVLLAIEPEWMLRIYTDNPQLISDSISSLYVMGSFYLIAVPGSILFNAVSGTGNTRIALGIEFITVCIYLLAIAFIIYYLQANVAVCWTVEHFYWLGMLVFSYLYLKKGDWQSKKI